MLGLRRRDVDPRSHSLNIRETASAVHAGSSRVGPVKTASSLRTVHYPSALQEAVLGHLETYTGPAIRGGYYVSRSVTYCCLSEDPSVDVALLEAGPSDLEHQEVLQLKRWPELLEGGLDWDYPIEPQERGNSFMRHARAKVLGGCSSHNSCIAFHPPAEDMDLWEELGAEGWNAETIMPLIARLETNMDRSGEGHGADGPVHLMDVPPEDPVGVACWRPASRRASPGPGSTTSRPW